MNTYYLKADSRADLIAALDAAGMWRDGFLPATIGDALDEIGTISRPTGATVMVDGIETQVMEPIPGYHANLLLHGDLPAAFAAIVIQAPANPVRVWA